MGIKRTRKKQEEFKVKQETWYGFNHEKVNKVFTGGLTFLNEFCVNGEYYPVAVYKVDSPDKSKGHKPYLLLNGSPHNVVRGMTQKEINKWRYQSAVACLNCHVVIYSINRHHMHSCECGKIAIDGGSCYTKISGNSGNYVLCKLDLLTNTPFCEIKLSKDKVTKLDIGDYLKFGKYRYRANFKGKWYAIRSFRQNKKHITRKLHREILELTDSAIMVDHINGDGLDNRKNNLRTCTNSQNQANQTQLTKRNKTGYKGVRLLPPVYKTKPFQAAITFNGKQIWLGAYKTKEEAANAYNVAATKYFGEFAYLNKLEDK